MPNTTFFKDYLNALTVGASLPTIGSTRFLGFFTAAPTVAGGGTEVTGGSYARIQLTPSMFGAAYTSADGALPANTRALANVLAILFSEASAAWGTITHTGIFDNATTGNLLSFFDQTDFTTPIGVQPNVPVGSLVANQS
jgi:hypothetical protein